MKHSQYLSSYLPSAICLAVVLLSPPKLSNRFPCSIKWLRLPFSKKNNLLHLTTIFEWAGIFDSHQSYITKWRPNILPNPSNPSLVYPPGWQGTWSWCCCCNWPPAVASAGHPPLPPSSVEPLQSWDPHVTWIILNRLISPLGSLVTNHTLEVESAQNRSGVP